jgi:DNA-directed RNA polymerase subunit RPC12/RpoP
LEEVLIKFHCSTCNRKIGVPTRGAGRKIKCPQCGQENVVPQPAPTPGEEIIDLSKEPDVHPALPTAPMAMAATARAPAVVPTLAYARPVPRRHAGRVHFDQKWMLAIRNALILMVLAISASILQAMVGPIRRSEVGTALFTIAIAGVDMIAAWLITTPDPEIGNGRITVLQIVTRVFAGMAAGGAILVATAALANQPGILIIGLGVAFAAIPLKWLMLFILRKIALRIGDDSLALQAMIVMWGLSFSLALVFLGVFMAAATLQSGFWALPCIALIGLCVFGIWYVILVIRFMAAFQ